jgi:hypothetical protein
MATKPGPTLEELERDLLQRTERLHRRLTALEGSMEALPPPSTPEKQAAALATGVRKLERAAYLARTAGVSISLPLADELRSIAQSIVRDGPDVQMGDLHCAVAAAVAVEAQTGVPVARRLAEAVAGFEKLFRQVERLSPRQWAARNLWKRQHLPRHSMGRERRSAD